MGHDAVRLLFRQARARLCRQLLDPGLKIAALRVGDAVVIEGDMGLHPAQEFEHGGRQAGIVLRTALHAGKVGHLARKDHIQEIGKDVAADQPGAVEQPDGDPLPAEGPHPEFEDAPVEDMRQHVGVPQRVLGEFLECRRRETAPHEFAIHAEQAVILPAQIDDDLDVVPEIRQEVGHVLHAILTADIGREVLRRQQDGVNLAPGRGDLLLQVIPQPAPVGVGVLQRVDAAFACESRDVVCAGKDKPDVIAAGVHRVGVEDAMLFEPVPVRHAGVLQKGGGGLRVSDMADDFHGCYGSCGFARRFVAISPGEAGASCCGVLSPSPVRIEASMLGLRRKTGAGGPKPGGGRVDCISRPLSP